MCVMDKSEGVSIECNVSVIVIVRLEMWGVWGHTIWVERKEGEGQSMEGK